MLCRGRPLWVLAGRDARLGRGLFKRFLPVGEEKLVDIKVFQDRILFRLADVPVTETMAVSLATSLVLVSLAYCLARAVRIGSQEAGSPGAAATTAEMAVEWLDDLVAGILGRSEPWVVTFSGTLFLFIAASTLVAQLPGVPSALANLSTTSALAGLVFFAVPIAGIRTHGVWRYVKHYFQPNPLFFPLHLISELSRTLALSMRLFGNMLSGNLIVGILVSLVGFLIPMPLMALDLLIGLLQAYIFTILSTVYIGAAIRAGEEV
jgi:F-type H+-transporting ATPase subunit a